VSDVALASLAALGSAALYTSAITLQALEARSAPAALELRPALFGFLVRRPRWVVGTTLGLLGWPLQALALAFGPLALVQPIQALSVVGLLAAGHRILGEPIGLRSLVAVAAIAGGIVLLALGAPTGTSDVSGALPVATLAGLGVCSLVPFARARGGGRSAAPLAFAAGAAYTAIALSTTLLDSALGRSAWLVAIVWLAVIGAAAAVGGLTEMSAFRLAAATVVAPIIFSVETVAPALLAPLVGEHLGTGAQSLAIDLAGLALVGAGVALLARSRSVARLMAAGA